MKKLNIIIITMVALILTNSTRLFASDRLVSEANLRFSHKTHELNSVNCSRCHVFDESKTQDKGYGLPPGWQPLRQTNIIRQNNKSMRNPEKDISHSFGRPPEEVCLQCHFGSREESNCALCHLDNPGETIRERKRLGEVYNFSHEDHENYECTRCHPGITGWETLDGHRINSRMEDCLVCHNGDEIEKDCLMCHNPTPRPADHTRNYIKKHGIVYRADPRQCNMCHEQSSCIECHSRKPRNHTLAWVRHRHGIAARTNPQKCRACHSDPWVCARCHDNYQW